MPWSTSSTGASVAWPSSAAAYNPASGTWRLLPDLPFRGMTGAWVAWTGREVLYWRPMGGDVLNGPAQLEPGLYAYDPEADLWRQAAKPPPVDILWSGSAVAWAGSELIIASTTRAQSHHQAVAYSPTTDAWRSVASGKPSRYVPYSYAVWTGQELVTLSFSEYSGAALRRRSGVWTKLPPGPDGLFGAAAVATDTGDVYLFGEENARLVHRSDAPEEPGR